MDPLSVAASIAGPLSAAGAVVKVLTPYIAAARETPKLAVQINSEIQNITIILSSLQSLPRTWHPSPPSALLSSKSTMSSQSLRMECLFSRTSKPSSG